MQTRIANLIVAGVSKCGSTSLFSYLAAHPDVCGSNVKETQFFMPLKFGKPLSPMSEYEKFFTECANEKYRLDATPYYLFGGKKIAQAIRENIGEVKIIFILRNPVGRCYSWYQHALYHLMIPKEISFTDYLKTVTEKIKSDVTVWDNYSRAIQESLYAPSLTEWFEVFSVENIKVIFFEHLKQSPCKVMNELCAWLEIDGAKISDEVLKPENTGGTYRFRWFRNLFLWARKNQEKLLLTNKRLNKFLKNIEQRFNKTSRANKMSEADKIYLEQLFKPYNQQLLQLLSAKGYSEFPQWVKE